MPFSLSNVLSGKNMMQWLFRGLRTRGTGRASMSKDHLDDIEQAAVDWFVRLHNEEATAQDHRAHGLWLVADPRHEVQWREVNALWSGIGDPDVAALPPPVPRRRAIRPWERNSLIPVAVRRHAMAAAVVLAVGAGGWMAGSPGYLADARSGVGETQIVTLADGSRVTLASKSSLSIDFTNGARDVILHDGEGFFSVAHDAARPFRVHVAGGSVTVLGTEFDVKDAAGAVAVEVVRGRVRVAAPRGEAVEIVGGQTVRFGKEGAGRPHFMAPDMMGLWREHRLAFDHIPLRQVLSDLGRYRKGRIIALGSHLDQLSVTGMFDLRHVDDALDTIERTQPVRVLRLWGLALVYSAG